MEVISKVRKSVSSSLTPVVFRYRLLKSSLVAMRPHVLR